jgi:glycosyltransferase involved in cell wall biosynthesis
MPFNPLAGIVCAAPRPRQRIAKKDMRIGMLGTRGIPASYSGFETCVEELGSRLVERGHDVTVYCRSHHIKLKQKHYKGMRLVRLPTIQNKFLDTIVHSFLSSIHASFLDLDVALFFIAGNSLVTFIPRLAGQKVVLNVDGLDWKREKWNSLAKRYIRFAEYLATIFPHEIVTDSTVVQSYYLQEYGKPSTFIAYGGDIEPLPGGKCLEEYGLQKHRYILFVGRLVPENCPHHLVEAFDGLGPSPGFKCVIVGDAPYAEDYIRSLRKVTNPDVVFTGYLFGEGYRELASNAYLFVETSEVGGTHPALLEAMALGNCVVVNDTLENLETVGEAGLSYEGKEGAQSLRAVLRRLLGHPDLVQEYGQRAQQRVREHYAWEKVTDDYERLFHTLLGK